VSDILSVYSLSGVGELGH